MHLVVFTFKSTFSADVPMIVVL